ncbi:hypothetical protein BECAL_01559 [Bellilinea caldifistulae]|uniref:Uncharacterized protein n=1 Tax=Bellilinea caldifistulae TaxID=360411 RepID=A0A0P6X370_9CHLR|nr:hypothetical protein [Bellilinea caldifistulae]KPL74207.1 hypothetical protein AC812_12890 [Bellilinea caldifistulae]GAP10392.1 hypothetical protein BECAL_01559 [Bellilinea caldifistulae]
MEQNPDSLELFWDNLLSRNPAQIEKAFLELDKHSKQAIIAHLQKMTSEPGWHPEQVKSAQIALKIIHISIQNERKDK